VVTLELGTFGAVLKYAIEIEDSASQYYQKLAAKASGNDQPLLNDLANGSKRNKQALERTRKMEMQEMILEAITGLDTVNYDSKFDESVDVKAGLKNALEIEGRASKFYAESASKLGFLGNVKKTLERLGKDREERGKKVKALL
jgi:rubrerythrin